MPAIVAENLTKTFTSPQGFWRWARRPPTQAVRGVSFSVEQGELFGLLGPNGAGKTTLTKMLCTLILPSSGRAMVAGHDLSQAAAIRRAVGLVVTDERSFYWRLSARRNLRFFAGMHGLFGAAAERRIAEVLAAVELTDVADERFSHYSTGMKQRTAIARALLHQPQILFLDEPSRSLDPVATQKLHDLVRRLVGEQGVTILLITHDLGEAEKLCGRVGLMHAGKIQAMGRPLELRRQLRRQLHYVVRLAGAPLPDLAPLQQIVPDVAASPAADPAQVLLSFRAGETDGRLNAVLDWLRGQGLAILSIEGQPPSLEEVFAHYTQEQG